MEQISNSQRKKFGGMDSRRFPCTIFLQVFDTGRSMLWIFYTVGYGLPSVIVLLSVLIVETSGIHGYGSPER